MTALQSAIDQLVERRISAMARAPRMWGSLESIELQALQLIEFLAVSYDQEYASSKSRAIKEQYRSFVRANYGGDLPAYLAQRLEKEPDQNIAAETLASIIKTFYGSIKRELRLSSDPLNMGDISIALLMQSSGTGRVSQPVIASYYSALPRAIRKIQSPKWHRGKVAKADQIDFVASAGIEVNPPNGTPGYIVMGVDITSDQLALNYSDPRARVAEQYKRFSDFVEIANNEPLGTITMDKLNTVYRDTEISHRMALAAMSMIPTAGQGVDRVVWGGKLLDHRRPFELSYRTADALMPIVQTDPHRKEFDEVGVIRTADLDRRRYRMRIKKGVRTFVLTDEVLHRNAATAVEILGQTVHARGFTVHGDSFVSEIEILPPSSSSI